MYYFGGSKADAKGLTMPQLFPNDCDAIFRGVPVEQLSILFQSCRTSTAVAGWSDGFGQDRDLGQVRRRVLRRARRFGRRHSPII